MVLLQLLIYTRWSSRHDGLGCHAPMLGITTSRLTSHGELMVHAGCGASASPIGWWGTSQALFTRGQFWPSGIVVACVCLCVRVCVCINHLLVRAITGDPFKLGSPNLDQRCKIPWLRSILFVGAIDLDLQDQIYLDRQNLPHFELVRTKTHHMFKLGSPNLDKRCKIPSSMSILFWRKLTLTFKVKFDVKINFLVSPLLETYPPYNNHQRAMGT